MSLILANIIGWIVAHRRIVAVIGATALLLLVVLIGVRSCRNTPKLNQQEVIKAQDAIEKQDRKTMIEVLTNSDVREQAIDSNIKQAEEATRVAKQNYADKTNAELSAELERRLHE